MPHGDNKVFTLQHRLRTGQKILVQCAALIDTLHYALRDFCRMLSTKEAVSISKARKA